MSADIKALSNRALVSLHEKKAKSISRLVDWFVKNGLGHMRPSDMRLMPNPPKQVLIYLGALDELKELKSEAQKRHGPGFIFMNDLH